MGRCCWCACDLGRNHTYRLHTGARLDRVRCANSDLRKWAGRSIGWPNREAFLTPKSASLATVSVHWLTRNDRLFGGVRRRLLRLLFGVSPPVDKPHHKREVPDLQQNRSDDAPGQRLPDRSRGHIGPSPDDARRRQHSHQKLRKIHRAHTPPKPLLI